MKLKKKIASTMLAASVAFTGLALAASPVAVMADEYPDEILLGAFWESDENVTNAVYWSTDGVNFYELAKAYEDSTPDDASSMKLVIKKEEDKLYYSESETLHDCSIVYTNLYKYADKADTVLDTSKTYGTYLMLSGYSTGIEDNEVFVPMIGYSNDLVNWAYPSSGSSVNVKVTEAPAGYEKYGNKWDSVAPDFFVDDDGTIWITMCLGYYANFHNDASANDIMQPYICKVESMGIRHDGDPSVMPKIDLKVSYSDAVPVNLPQYYDGYTVNNRIDSSFYKENGVYYLCIKKDGVTDEVWEFTGSEFNLQTVQNQDNWKIISEDAVTGFEGPSLTKYEGRYYLYTDKLKDYGDNPDGKAGIYVNVASTATTGKLDEYTGWMEKNQFKVHTYDADGNEVGNRHGTVITITDKAAIRQIIDLKATTANAGKTGRDNTPELAYMGWYQLESYNASRYGGIDHCYWYEGDVRQGVRIGDSSYRGKEIYDPDTDGWYWLDNCNDGLMAVSKDVLLPTDSNAFYEDEEAYGTYEEHPDRWKWARYDQFGKMMKGQIQMPIAGADENADWGYWWFDEITGAMQKGLTEVYDVRHELVPITDRNGNVMKDSDGNIAMKTAWYKVDADGNRTTDNDKAVKRTVYYDETTGIMQKGEQIIGDRLYLFDQAGTAVNGWYAISSIYNEAGEVIDGWHYATDDNGETIVKDKNDVKVLCWYENGERQGYKVGDSSYRGKEVYDPFTDAWYWCDNIQMGAVACDKDVYQESYAGDYGDFINPETGERCGKWVRYDRWGKMIKGWDWGALDNNGIHQYFDLVTGAMAKGDVTFYNEDGTVEHWTFDKTTGIGERID